MADFPFQAFYHGAYIAAGKDWAATLTLLETALVGNYNLFNDGGRMKISSSVGGKTFTWVVPQQLGPAEVGAWIERAWQTITAAVAANPADPAAQTAALLSRDIPCTYADFSSARFTS